MNRLHLFSAAAAGAALALITVVNCGAMSDDPAGRDGSLGAIDSAQADVIAATTSSFSCDRSYTYTYTYPGSWTQTYTTYYADVNVAELAVDSDVAVTTCGYECFGQTCQPFVCPAGTTCTQSGTPPAQLDCTTAWGSFQQGRIVVWCGSHGQVDYVDPATADSEWGSRYSHGFVRVR